jgi:hypothetical protein
MMSSAGGGPALAHSRPGRARRGGDHDSAPGRLFAARIRHGVGPLSRVASRTRHSMISAQLARMSAWGSAGGAPRPPAISTHHLPSSPPGCGSRLWCARCCADGWYTRIEAGTEDACPLKGPASSRRSSVLDHVRTMVPERDAFREIERDRLTRPGRAAPTASHPCAKFYPAANRLREVGPGSSTPPLATSSRSPCDCGQAWRCKGAGSC